MVDPSRVPVRPAEPRRVLYGVPTMALVVGVMLWVAPSLPAGPAPATPASAPSRPATATQAPGLRTIVLDPGHGGLAAGAVGPGGLTEKEITLDIALRLRELIFRRLGLRVMLTREGDDDVPLDQRTEKANSWGADLFMSIHANAYKLADVRGPETYFLSAAASDRLAREVAASENDGGPAGAEATTSPGQRAVEADQEPLDFILWDLAQTEHLRESGLLAETVQTDLRQLWRMTDRGVRQAPFRVLKGATMPAILVEVGYLSNEQDASLLADPVFRQQVAESLFRSINAFRERYAVLAGAAPVPE